MIGRDVIERLHFACGNSVTSRTVAKYCERRIKARYLEGEMSVQVAPPSLVEKSVV